MYFLYGMTINKPGLISVLFSFSSSDSDSESEPELKWTETKPRKKKKKQKKKHKNSSRDGKKDEHHSGKDRRRSDSVSLFDF